MSKVSKVIYGDTTVIDITDSTVNANNLLSGNKAYGADGEPVIGALSVGSTVNVTTTDSTIFGETLTLSDGTTTLSTTFDNSGDATFESVLLTGSLTLACQGYEMSITILTYDTYNVTFITIPEGATVTPTDDIQTWLACANITDKTYTTLAEVLADEVTYETLLRDSNACDYMARSTSWAGDPTVKVPTMTSNTTPSGVVSAKSRYDSSTEPWMAFDGAGNSSGWLSSSFVNSPLPQWIQYDFGKQVNINLVYMQNKQNSSYIINQFKIQGSNNGSEFTDLTDILTNKNTGESGISTYEIESENSYRYIRMEIENVVGTVTYACLGVLQFYHTGITTNETAMRYLGKYDYACEKLLGNATWVNAIANSDYWEYVFNYSVPKMTSNTAPSGTVSGSTMASSYPAWKAFDRDNSTFASLNTSAKSGYVQYDFGSAVKISSFSFLCTWSPTEGCNLEISYSDDNSTFISCGTYRYESTDNGNSKFFKLDNDYGSHRYWKLLRELDTNSRGAVAYEVQFYGRKPISNNYISLVPVMTSDTTPMGEAFRSAGVSGGDAYKAFNGSSSTYASVTYATDAYVGYHFTSPKVVNRCSFLATSTTTAVFALDASNNGTDWTTLGTLNGSSSGYTTTNYTLDVQNTTAYSYYRTRISQKGSESWSDYNFYTIEYLSKLDKTIVHSTPLDTIYYMSNGTPITVCTTDSNGIGEFDLADFSDATYTLYSSVAKDPSNLSNDFSKAIRITKTQWGGTTELYLMPSTINTLYWYGNYCMAFISKAPNRTNVTNVSGTVSNNVNNFTFTVGNAGHAYDGATYVTNDVLDLSSVNKMKIVIGSASLNQYSASSIFNAGYFASGATSFVITGNALVYNSAITNNTFVELDISSLGNSQLGIYGQRGSSGSASITISIKAMWLDK